MCTLGCGLWFSWPPAQPKNKSTISHVHRLARAHLRGGAKFDTCIRIHVRYAHSTCLAYAVEPHSCVVYFHPRLHNQHPRSYSRAYGAPAFVSDDSVMSGGILNHYCPSLFHDCADQSTSNIWLCLAHQRVVLGRRAALVARK